MGEFEKIATNLAKKCFIVSQGALHVPSKEGKKRASDLTMAKDTDDKTADFSLDHLTPNEKKLIKNYIEKMLQLSLSSLIRWSQKRRSQTTSQPNNQPASQTASQLASQPNSQQTEALADLLKQIEKCNAMIDRRRTNLHGCMNEQALRSIIIDPYVDILCEVWGMKVVFEKSMSSEKIQGKADYALYYHQTETQTETKIKAKTETEIKIKTKTKAKLAVVIEAKISANAEHAIAQGLGYCHCVIDDDNRPPLLITVTEKWAQLVLFPFNDKTKGVLLPQLDIKSRMLEPNILRIITLLLCPNCAITIITFDEDKIVAPQKLPQQGKDSGRGIKTSKEASYTTTGPLMEASNTTKRASYTTTSTTGPVTRASNTTKSATTSTTGPVMRASNMIKSAVTSTTGPVTRASNTTKRASYTTTSTTGPSMRASNTTTVTERICIDPSLISALFSLVLPIKEAPFTKLHILAIYITTMTTTTRLLNSYLMQRQLKLRRGKNPPTHFEQDIKTLDFSNTMTASNTTIVETEPSTIGINPRGENPSTLEHDTDMSQMNLPMYEMELNRHSRRGENPSTQLNRFKHEMERLLRRVNPQRSLPNRLMYERNSYLRMQRGHHMSEINYLQMQRSRIQRGNHHMLLRRGNHHTQRRNRYTRRVKCSNTKREPLNARCQI